MSLLKQLREATLAPLKECKEALVEANGDLDEAKEILRKKGMNKAGKKADRETNEGLVKVENKNNKVVALKLLCETDFVAKNEVFSEFMDVLIEKIAGSVTTDVNAKEELNAELLEELNTMIAEFVGKMGENVQLGDVIVSTENAYVYNHPGNKVASIIFFEGNSEDTAKEIALQVAAMNPTYLDFDAVPSEDIKKMEVEFREELLKSGKPENIVDQIVKGKISGKPENIVDQIVKGKISKSLADYVLLEQAYIRDGAKKIKEIIPSDFVVKSYKRIAIQ